jgi:hypothetical protein
MIVETSHIWIFCGLLLLGAEILLPGVYMLWVGLAAILTGLVMMLVPLSFGVTVAVFLVFLAAGVAVALRLRKTQRPRPRINTPDSGLVGRHGVLLDDNPAAPRVRLGDSDWAARLPRDGGIAVGARVRVDGVDGNTLIVKAD